MHLSCRRKSQGQPRSEAVGRLGPLFAQVTTNLSEPNLKLNELRQLARAAAFGLALAVLTGATLFTVRSQEYLQNPAFVVKMAPLSEGAVNAWLVRRGGAWGQILQGGCPSRALRCQDSVSLLLWTGCLVADRWIGFCSLQFG